VSFLAQSTVIDRSLRTSQSPLPRLRQYGIPIGQPNSKTPAKDMELALKRMKEVE
jgi:hypothetical protein